MIDSPTQLKARLREIAVQNPEILSKRNGRWQLQDRVATWKAVAPQVFDNDLDRIAKIALRIFNERNTEFDLPADQRYMSGIYGKGFAHSRDLRNGIAETLALIGSFPDLLTNCSDGKPEYTCTSTVKSLLSTADWVLWASLNDVLPLIAECSPEAFLSSIEIHLKDTPTLFKRIFEQEGPSFGGTTYITGLLWGLEALSWEPLHFVRTVLCLARLAEVDPGGNYANRPANSLITIFLPWFPQTMAPREKRLAAMKILVDNHPTIAWKLLLDLLPNARNSSSMSHRPRFRPFVPQDWDEGVTYGELRQQTNDYSQLAVELARADVDRQIELLGHISQVPPVYRKRLLDHIESASNHLTDPERTRLWDELTRLRTRHVRYAKARWTLPQKELSKINRLIRRLAPSDPEVRFRSLFDSYENDLYESSDFFTERELLQRKRRAAIGKIYEAGGLDSVMNLARDVKFPNLIGSALADWLSTTAHKKASTEVEDLLFPSFLDSVSKTELAMLAGFVALRFNRDTGEWMKALTLREWTPHQTARFLTFLPFKKPIWDSAERVLGTKSHLYWKLSSPTGFDLDNIDLTFAVDRLLENERQIAAIDLLVTGIYGGLAVESGQVIRAIDALEPDDIRRVGVSYLSTLIKQLQDDSSSNKDDVARIEWTFLSILDGISEGRPLTLEAQMATTPSLFCEIIQLAFLSEKVTKRKADVDKSKAMNAIRLLRNWRTPPGTLLNGEFSSEALRSWLDDVKSTCKKTGHLVIALQQVGAVFFYAPQDPDGLWLHRAVAEVLNADDAEEMRTGFRVEVFNSRGAHFVDPTGDAERTIASEYRRKAEEIENAGYFRIATSLRELANQYDLDAKRIAKNSQTILQS